MRFIHKHKENLTAPTRDWRITLGNRLVMDFLVFKPQFSRRLSRIFFSVSLRLSRNFHGRLAGLSQIAAGGRLSRWLRGLFIYNSKVLIQIDNGQKAQNKPTTTMLFHSNIHMNDSSSQ